MASKKKVPAVKSKAAKSQARVKKAGRPKPGAKRSAAGKSSRSRSQSAPASQNRGLIIFGIVACAVLLLAVVGKLRQGPPVKLMTPEVLQTFSAGETQFGPLSSPRGIGVDSQGNVFVADLGNHRLVKFGAQGGMVDAWGRKGEAAGEFNEPSGVAVSAGGEVFVADAWNGRIQKFSPAGEYLGEITAKTGNFYSPRNVALDAAGFIYVADTGNSCIKKFDTDANLVKRWGEYGTGPERFQETFGIWVDRQGQIYVGDAGNRRIKIFTAEGKPLRSIRVKGWQSGVSWPMMTADSAGQVYAVDTQHNMVWIYDARGKYLGSWGNKPNKNIFASPLGITVDSHDAIYVSNMNQGEIIKLQGFKK